MSSILSHHLSNKSPPFLPIPAAGHPNARSNHAFRDKNASFHRNPPPRFPNRRKKQFFTPNFASFLKISAAHLPKSTPKLPNEVLNRNIEAFLDFSASHFKNPFNFIAMCVLSSPLPSFADEVEESTAKINIESVVVGIDDFFNRNPFFVAGVTFIWLIGIPLTQEYLKKYKLISAGDAFRKLRDLPGSQLLDIRKKQSVMYLGSPNLKILNKKTVQVEFVEGNEEDFLKEVSKNFADRGNTVICVLDSFDGNSLQVAELLYKNGFKEAYAIKGGLRGKDGWQAIQETFLPPSVHVYPRKENGKATAEFDKSVQEINGQNLGNGQLPTATNVLQDEKLNAEESIKPEPASEAKLAPRRPLSPYPNYPDLKPPTSPTPSKPKC